MMRRSQTILFSVACGWTIALISATAHADLQSPATTLAENVQQADYVVTGTVTETTSSMSRVRGLRFISTAVRVHVSECLKAPAGEPIPQELTVRVPGGQVGDLVMRVSDLTAFHQGDRAVLLLRAADPAYADKTCQLVNGHLGVYPITTDPNTGQDIVSPEAQPSIPAPAGVSQRNALAVTAAAPTTGVPLTQFLEQLKGLVHGTR